MAKYTTQVRSICEVSAGLDESVGYADVDSVIAKAIPKIFNFSFPIFDEAYRLPLEKKILKHYYTREIGLETVGLWKLKLDTKLNEIMPYYNQLYKSALIEFNPLYDIDLTREHEGEANQKSDTQNRSTDSQQSNVTNELTGLTTNADNSTDKFSDTPQGGLTGLAADNYLTNATMHSGASSSNVSNESTSATTASGSSTTDIEGNIDSTDKYIEHIYGVHGGMSYSKRIMDFRKTFLNVDMMIIDELKDLFFLLW